MVSNETIQYIVTLTFSGGLLTRQAGGIRFGLDQAMLRHWKDGRPAIPGTVIKGNLRHAWEGLMENGIDEISDDCIHSLLGQSPTAAGRLHRGWLLFDDLWVAVDGAGYETQVRHRIRIDAERGAVAPGALLMAEQVLPQKNGKLEFRGQIELTNPRAVGGTAYAKILKRWIANGLAYAQAIGAFKGLGWGKLEEVNVKMRYRALPRVSLPRQGSGGNGTAAIGLHVTLDRPFCIPRPAAGENTIVSEEFIPGAVLKGALATTLERLFGDEWRRHFGDSFDRLRFTHAFPVSDAASDPARPLAIPWSLIIGKDAANEEIRDLANADGPPEGWREVRFPLDWKAATVKKVRADLGWPEAPRRELRVHNRIDPKSGTTEENALFTVESVMPDRYCWLANVYGGSDDITWLKEFLRALSSLPYPVYPLGRTKARVKIEVRDDPWPTHGARSPSALQSGNSVRLLLQTPARLLDISACGDIPPTGGEARLKECYREVWRELSEGALVYHHHYGRQMLFGGEYWWRHYMQEGECLEAPNGYRPELFSAPGSLFVLTVEDPVKAQEKLCEWETWGLSYRNGMAGGDAWRSNPWLTCNGFGEVVIDPQLPYRS